MTLFTSIDLVIKLLGFDNRPRPLKGRKYNQGLILLISRQVRSSFFGRLPQVTDKNPHFQDINVQRLGWLFEMI
jgi:hypothetical protein